MEGMRVVGLGLNKSGGTLLGYGVFWPRTLALRVTASCPQTIVQMWTSNLTVAEDVYRNLVPVEDLVQDVTPECAKNFLQSDLVRLRCLTSYVSTACNLGSDIVRQEKGRI